MARRRLLANDILRLFVRPQPQEDRLAELVIQCPLGELDLGDQHGFKPMAALHHCRRNPHAPTPSRFLRQIYKRAIGLFQLV